MALVLKMPANAGRRGDLAPTHELTCAGELQRAMVLEVKALTAPGTFAKVAVVYPAKEKKAIKALHAVCDASRMLAEVNIPKRSDWAGGGTMVGGGCMLTRDGLSRDGLLKPNLTNYAAKPGCQLPRKHKVLIFAGRMPSTARG